MTNLIHRTAAVSLLAVGLWGAAAADPSPPAGTFSNPVITGFAPDPSIVRVEEDFYLVNSTFEYFPGIPIYHSRDLVNWDLIGHALTDPAQVDLDRVASGGGIHASTIRHHDGTFYVITTNVLDGTLRNFIVTATDPRGPWSAPHVLEGAPGIDPSLHFDEHGRVWYVGNRAPPDPSFAGEMEIWLQELDLERMALTGERHYLWRGCCGGAWAEGPHLYQRDGYYYLLISEGGTAFEHAVSVAVSERITGPYQNNPRNPVLSHRQLSYDHPITGVGHADLVELADGRWYAVALGWRLIDGRHGILGRETFLLPVSWETEPYWWKEPKFSFPVFSPDSGKVELHYPTPFSGTVQRPPAGFADEFDGPALSLEWNVRRTPDAPFYSLGEHPGALRLALRPGRIAERGRYSFVGIRQRQLEFEALTRMRFAPLSDAEEAGLVAIQNDRAAFLMTLAGGENGTEIRLYQSLQGEITPLASESIAGEAIDLRVTGDYLDYRFSYSVDGRAWSQLGDPVDGIELSPAVIRGYNYTGAYVGLYGSSNGTRSDNHADFEFFRYRPLQPSRDRWYHRQRQREATRSADAAGAASPAATPGEYRLYFLGGQSNMEGFGYVDELPAELRGSVDRVMIFTGQMVTDGESGAGIGAWERLRPGHGTGFGSDGRSNRHSDRFGPELSFGARMAALLPDTNIAIVKYSRGGTALAPNAGYGSWDPDYTEGNRRNQYDHALATIANALSQPDVDGDGIRDRLVPAGIIWMQGEADAFDSEAAAQAYAGNLKRMMNLLRAALRTDGLPVVVGRITDSGMAEDGSVMDHIEIVQRAQADFTRADECAALVTVTDDLDYLEDGWHYDTEGYLRLGAAFAEAVTRLDADCGLER